MTQSSRAPLALAGVVTGAAGLAVSQAVATGLRARVTPVVAVGETVRDLTPGPLAHALVSLVGTRDKPLLIAGTMLVMLAITAYAGMLVRRHPLVPDLVFLGLAALGLVATLTRTGATMASAIAIIAGLVTWIVVFRMLTDPLRSSSSEDRRAFLRRTGIVVAGAGAAVVLGRVAGRGRRAVEQARRLLRLQGTAGVVPKGAQAGPKGIAPWRTPSEEFYLIDTALAPPSIRPSEWRLRVHGAVDREVELSYDDLIERRQSEGWITLCCVSNEVGGDLIGNAWWTGVPVREVLEMAGVHADADAVLQTSADGWTCVTPLAALTDDRDALLAVAMNGQPLEIEHGFPVRMVVPGLYGYVSATKWLVDLKVSRFADETGYWTTRGWSAEGPIKTQSRIDVPRSGQQVATGTIGVGGVAWAQHTGIEKVEFSLDGGEWREASLGVVPNLDTWVQWHGEVDVEAGDHELRVRATDRSGTTQTAVRAGVLPDGATGWHTVGFSAH